jgi:hypothetical protein
VTRLGWPPGFERVPSVEREPNRSYDVSLSTALDELEAELERLGAEEYRLSTAAPQRQRDNRPYANASPDDPGAVVRWTMDGEQYAVACDAYSRLRDNVRTIGLYVREKRKMEQRPVVTGESEFANARLPSGAERDVIVAGDGSGRAPHEILGVTADAPEEAVRGAARQLKRKHHPDQGGDQERFKAVVAAEQAMLGEGGA